jgi:hypothetical protein
MWCNMLSGGDNEYAMSTCVSDGNQQSIANCYLLLLLKSRRLNPLIYSVIIANMQPPPIRLHTYLNRVPITAKE